MPSPDLEAIQAVKNGLVVSCQASDGEPLAVPECICALALSAIAGGACALRLEGAGNVAYVRKHTKLPIIALTKAPGIPEDKRLESVYITGTFAEAKALAAAGADVIALDATGRARPQGEKLGEIIERIHKETGLPVWADVATYEEGVEAARLGADVVSTTLSGYTKETAVPAATSGPDLQLLGRLCRHLSVPVVLEGRVWNTTEVTEAFRLGAHAVVVGSAITRPHLITERFVRAIPGRK